MYALDHKCQPSYRDVLVAGKAQPKKQARVCLPKNKITAISDLEDEWEARVQFIE